MNSSKLKFIGLSLLAICILIIALVFIWEPWVERVTPSEPSGKENDYEYVDLGLSVKWATCNVGAQNPSQCGHYNAWGSNDGYAYIIGDIGGSELDPAHVERGGNWRIPTIAECKELTEKCTWIWGIYDGQKGCKVIGPNGNSIFLPAGGYPYNNRIYNKGEQGYYWSSTPNDRNDEYAFGFDFTEIEPSRESYFRRRHRSIRPVLGNEIPTTKYEVGDYYNVNGKRGIVFSVDETGFHGKIVSMTQSRNELKWTSDKSMHKEQIGANDKSLGLNNMDVIKSCEDWRKKYPAFAWCEQLGEGWYLPALREAEKILHVELMNLLNKRLIAHGGQPIAGGAAYYWTSAAYYWTSTEGGDSGAWVAYEHRYHSFGSSVEHKSVVHYVRAVSLF